MLHGHPGQGFHDMNNGSTACNFIAALKEDVLIVLLRLTFG
jgi:hypothetical protein